MYTRNARHCGNSCWISCLRALICGYPESVSVHGSGGHKRGARLCRVEIGRDRSSSRRMRILLDMNLSPRLATELIERDVEAVHWLDLGDPRATDSEILNYALSAGFTVLTHDLDFGAILAATNARGPSVVQIRTQDLLSESIAALIARILTSYENEIAYGCLITIDPVRSRLRLLPFR
jgi:predicted nuclease of predicted toxin-antitoxin system